MRMLGGLEGIDCFIQVKIGYLDWPNKVKKLGCWYLGIEDLRVAV